MSRKNLVLVLAILGVFLLTPLSADARPPRGGGGGNPYSSLISNAHPCVMSDFVGGLPYPQGWGPYVFFLYPNTGDTVPRKGYAQPSAFAGMWVGDTNMGSLLQIQLFVDGTKQSIWDPSSGTTSELPWSTSVGTHAFMLRLYTMDWARTKACYLDSEIEYPVAK